MDERIKLNNGVAMPRVGIGGWAQSKENILRAIRVGYRLIDTAAQYGNEEETGVAIAESGIKREDIFITTKIWTQDIRERKVIEAFEESLKRLGVTYVDLLLIHWPAEGFEDAWLTMEKIYREGKVRAIGVSNFEKHHMMKLKEHGAGIVPAVNQIESHPFFANNEIINASRKMGVVPEAWCPLGGPESGEIKDPTINEIAQKHHKTAAQVILRWHMQKDVVVIPKSSKEIRMIENLNVFDFNLYDEEIKSIDHLEEGRRLGAHPDKFDF